MGEVQRFRNSIKYIKDKERYSTPENRAQVAAITNSTASAISFVSDEKYVPVLAPLLQHPSLTVRRSAITALRTIAQSTSAYRSSLPEAQKNVKEIEQLRARLMPLFMATLDDPIVEIRIQALWSLSEAARKPWGPYDFHQLEEKARIEAIQKLIAQWKEWWQAGGRKELRLYCEHVATSAACMQNVDSLRRFGKRKAVCEFLIPSHEIRRWLRLWRRSHPQR